MCRVLAYLGEPIPVRRLLFDTDHSLVAQSYSPKMMNTTIVNAMMSVSFSVSPHTIAAGWTVRGSVSVSAGAIIGIA